MGTVERIIPNRAAAIHQEMAARADAEEALAQRGRLLNETFGLGYEHPDPVDAAAARLDAARRTLEIMGLRHPATSASTSERCSLTRTEQGWRVQIRARQSYSLTLSGAARELLRVVVPGQTADVIDALAEMLVEEAPEGLSRSIVEVRAWAAQRGARC